MFKFSLALANGSNQYVALTAGPFASGSFSLSFWVKLTSNGLRYAFSQGSTGSDQLSVIISNGGHVQFFSNGGTLNVLGSAVIPLATWAHVCCTYDSGTTTGTVYVNGVLDNSGTGTVGYTNTACRLGGPLSGTSSLDALLGGTRAYASALTSAQILYLTQGHITPGAADWWPFDEGTGTSTADPAGALTGTLTNGVTWSKDVPLSFNPRTGMSGRLGMWRGDQSASFNAVAINNAVANSHSLATSGAFTTLNAVSKFTVAGFINVPGSGNSTALLAQQNSGATQQCFSVLIVAGGQLQVNVSANLTDSSANHAVGSIDLRAGSHAQASHHVAVVYDGTQSTNATKLKIYIDGVQDTSLAFTGTIPAATTSSTATLTFGVAPHDATAGFNFLALWDWGVWAGAALSAANVTVLANWNQSGYGGYYNYAGLPAGVPAPTNFWQLSESSNGSGAVTRADSAGPFTLADATNCPSAAFLQAADYFGNGNLGQSLGYFQLALTAQVPTIDSAATPSGMNAFKFPGPRTTLCGFDCGKLGRTTNAASGSVYALMMMPDITQGGVICGAERFAANGGGTHTSDAWMCLENNITTTPGAPASASGSGLVAAGTGPISSVSCPANTIANNTWAVVRGKFTPGDGHVRMSANGSEQTVVDHANTPFDGLGGTMGRFGFGTTPDWNPITSYAKNYVGDLAALAVFTAWNADADVQMVAWLIGLGGLSAPSVAVPANFFVYPDNGATHLRWTPTTGANRYNIYRSTTTGAETLYDTVTGAGSSSYTDSAVSFGTAYFYKVSAVVSTDTGTYESSLSAEAKAAAALSAITLFTTSSLPGLALDWEAAGFTGWNTADFAQVGSQYLSAAVPTAWKGTSKFTLFGTAMITPNLALNVSFTFAAAQDAAASNMMFWVGRDSSNHLRVNIASSLSDTGANFVSGSQLMVGDNDQSGVVSGTSFYGQGYLPFCVVFDGTQSGAARIRLYVSGVKDPSVTVTGTIPAALTSPSGATFTAGWGLHDGAAFNGDLYNLGLIPGYAASDSEAAGLANVQASGFPAPYNWFSWPAAAPAQSNFSPSGSFWPMTEASTGAAPVTRYDYAPALVALTDGAGAGGNVPAKATGGIADQSGNNYYGTFATRKSAGSSGTVAPQPVAGDGNGHGALHFSTSTSVSASVRFGNLGLTTCPGALTHYHTVNYDFSDSSHEMWLCGADINRASIQNADANCVGEVNCDDFSTHPASLHSVASDGTNVQAWSTPANVTPVGVYGHIAYRFVPGTPGVAQIAVNNVQQTMTPRLSPSFPPFTPVNSMAPGGKMAYWSFAGIGNLDQSLVGPPACWMGKALRETVCFAQHTDDQITAKYVHDGLRYGLTIAAPAAPAGPAAGVGPAAVAVTWNGVTGSGYYNVYRGTSSGTEALYTASPTTSFNDPNTSPGTTYYYKVSAVYASVAGLKESSLSVEASGSWTLPAPTGLAVSSSPPGVGLTWGAVASASFYNVYRSTTPGNESLYTSNVPSNAFTDQGAAPGTSYFYKVTAASSNLAGNFESVQSAEAGGSWSLPAPTGLTATDTATPSVVLNWGAVTGVTGYNVYRGTVSGGETLYAPAVVGTSYTDTSGTPGVTYFYKVSSLAANNTGSYESPLSAEASAVLPPPAPTGLAVTGTFPGNNLTWHSVVGASTYNVYRGLSSGTETLLTSGVAGTSYADTTAQVGVLTFYKVTAVAGGIEGAFSNEASATRAPSPLTDTRRIWPGLLPGRALECPVSVYGDANDDSFYAFSFAEFAEARAGQTITATSVEYRGLSPAAPALALPAATTVPGVASGDNTQIMVEVRPAAACQGFLYTFSATATFSAGNKRVARGLLCVTGPSGT